MKKNPLVQKVNFYISVTCMLCFGLLMVTMVYRAENLGNPILDAAASLGAYNSD